MVIELWQIYISHMHLFMVGDLFAKQIQIIMGRQTILITVLTRFCTRLHWLTSSGVLDNHYLYLNFILVLSLRREFSKIKTPNLQKFQQVLGAWKQLLFDCQYSHQLCLASYLVDGYRNFIYINLSSVKKWVHCAELINL